ncbi:antitoxin VbhA family protein [Adhaeribacter aquaticus]|uniref:antitoxin VbhA family protein n=1 Tax=Adhaeribacter aquaticus TaxID=299567 RepID=UPI000417DE22|nr:antitoxin VbhA family protein [Adhaeribacter aquaticus]
MENRNWIPGGTFFKPAPLGLSIEELEERARRESSANHGIALVMSNGPKPSEEAIAIMQKYVDGECTLEEVLAETLKLHGINKSDESPVPNQVVSKNREGGISVTEEPDNDELYWMQKIQMRPATNQDTLNREINKRDLPDLFDQTGKI